MASAGRKRLGVALAVGATLLVTALVAFAFGFEPLVKRIMVSKALERGIVLEPGKLGVGVGWVELVDSRFSLLGVRGASGTIKRFQVDLSGLTPEKITVEGLDAEAVGDPQALAGDMTKWADAYRKKFVTPLSASGVVARWRPAGGAPPVVELSDVAVTPGVKGATVDASVATVSGVAVGPLHAELVGNAATVSLGLGSKPPAKPPISATLDATKADVTLAPIDVSGLTTLLGVKLPLPGVKVGATLHVERPPGGLVTGKLSADLQGFVPPHPRELDGIVFGTATHVETAFVVAKDDASVALDHAAVKAGAFKLTGKGLVTREGDHARIQLDLAGNIACTTLATSAAESRLGHVVGAWVASAAHKALQGSVGVVVKIDASTTDLEGAKVQKTIGIGCGLKPVALPDVKLPDFQLPPLPTLPLPGFGPDKAPAPAASAH